MSRAGSNRALLAGGLTVTDEEVRAAMRFAFAHLKLVIEPAGAVALAAALHQHLPPSAGATAAVVSGANGDPALYASILLG